jgi:hypothetical protein
MPLWVSKDYEMTWGHPWSLKAFQGYQECKGDTGEVGQEISTQQNKMK